MNFNFKDIVAVEQENEKIKELHHKQMFDEHLKKMK